MTTIKFNVSLSKGCTLTVQDVTGFTSDNTTGFALAADAVTAGNYKLGDGYFLNFIIYNGYNVQPTIINSTETFFKVTTVDYTAYANNLTPLNYQLVNDGYYTVKRVFLISDVYYNANKGSGLFNTYTVYYTDGIDIHSVVNGVDSIVTRAAFVNSELSNITGSVATTSFISTCNINACYYKFMSTLLASTNCKDMAILKQNRDFLFMTLEVIKYLKDVNNISEIQQLIDGVMSCGGLCNSTANSSNGCGCG